MGTEIATSPDQARSSSSTASTDVSTARTVCPAASSSVHAEAIEKGWWPSSYVEMSSTSAMRYFCCCGMKSGGS